MALWGPVSSDSASDKSSLPLGKSLFDHMAKPYWLTRFERKSRITRNDFNPNENLCLPLVDNSSSCYGLCAALKKYEFILQWLSFQPRVLIPWKRSQLSTAWTVIDRQSHSHWQLIATIQLRMDGVGQKKASDRKKNPKKQNPCMHR